MRWLGLVGGLLLLFGVVAWMETLVRRGGTPGRPRPWYASSAPDGPRRRPSLILAWYLRMLASPASPASLASAAVLLGGVLLLLAWWLPEPDGIGSPDRSVLDGGPVTGLAQAMATASGTGSAATAALLVVLVGGVLAVLGGAAWVQAPRGPLEKAAMWCTILGAGLALAGLVPAYRPFLSDPSQHAGPNLIVQYAPGLPRDSEPAGPGPGPDRDAQRLVWQARQVATLPFDAGEDSLPSRPDVHESLCRARAARAASSGIVFVIAGHDRSELTPRARVHHGSNASLAQRRAMAVAAALGEASGPCDYPAIGDAIAIGIAAVHTGRAASADDLAADRQARILVLGTGSVPAR